MWVWGCTREGLSGLDPDPLSPLPQPDDGQPSGTRLHTDVSLCPAPPHTAGFTWPQNQLRLGFPKPQHPTLLGDPRLAQSTLP